ncbi:MAG: HAD family phosphatase [Ardenticatenaceae bacterium]|nr:HAD family phosphatase [Ardenticatenaceae bacterium]MCB8975349.1 HAD family phosphatase [Ardenticatenaceae bacterium]
MSQLQAIIFDMDGLMVDSEPLSQQAWDEYLRPYGHQLTPEIVSQIIGLRADMSTPTIKEMFNLPEPVPVIIQKRAAIYSQIRANGVPTMPGLHELHDEIARRQIPWAVATSSPHHHAEEILQQLGLQNRCRAIAAGDEVADGKPNPAIYLLAAERLGIPPQHCLALEDSGPGSLAAARAGMTAIAIPNAQTKTADFSHVHHRYSSLHEVLANLDTFFGD